jgi:hypothetical protein
MRSVRVSGAGVGLFDSAAAVVAGRAARGSLGWGLLLPSRPPFRAAEGTVRLRDHPARLERVAAGRYGGPWAW